MNVNQERIKQLQQEMKAAGMEHVSPLQQIFISQNMWEHIFKVRAWLSGFSGSAGTLLVRTADKAISGQMVVLYSGCKAAGAQVLS